jgi:hypothetical protein
MDAGAGDDAGDGVWVTYSELAKARGIERRAATRLAQRRRWRRQAGNDGLARVLVPHDWLRPADRGRDIAGDDVARRASDDAGNVARAIAVLQRAVDMLQDQLAAERGRGDDAGDRADRSGATAAELRAQLADAQAALSAAQADVEQMEARTAELAARLDQARAEAQQAAQAASELRRADFMTRGRAGGAGRGSGQRGGGIDGASAVLGLRCPGRAGDARAVSGMVAVRHLIDVLTNVAEPGD